jgi:very-short-patch-repair endonuclease
MNNYVVMSNYRIKNLPSLRDYRKKLRRNSTSAEAELWKLLKGKKLDGRKFRRQYSIGNYILDFYCVSDRLAIELDGDRHGDYVIINRDEEREIYLQKLGIRILRFENRMLFQEPEMVLKTIQSMLTEE